MRASFLMIENAFAGGFHGGVSAAVWVAVEHAPYGI